MVNYWETRSIIFEDEAFLPIRLEGGAMREQDIDTLRWGHTEILPDDKHGRLVLSHDRSKFRLEGLNHPSVVSRGWIFVQNGVVWCAAESKLI
jgi:hypothetical protein